MGELPEQGVEGRLKPTSWGSPRRCHGAPASLSLSYYVPAHLPFLPASCQTPSSTKVEKQLPRLAQRNYVTIEPSNQGGRKKRRKLCRAPCPLPLIQTHGVRTGPSEEALLAQTKADTDDLFGQEPQCDDSSQVVQGMSGQKVSMAQNATERFPYMGLRGADVEVQSVVVGLRCASLAVRAATSGWPGSSFLSPYFC